MNPPPSSRHAGEGDGDDERDGASASVSASVSEANGTGTGTDGDGPGDYVGVVAQEPPPAAVATTDDDCGGSYTLESRGPAGGDDGGGVFCAGPGSWKRPRDEEEDGDGVHGADGDDGDGFGFGEDDSPMTEEDDASGAVATDGGGGDRDGGDAAGEDGDDGDDDDDSSPMTEDGAEGAAAAADVADVADGGEGDRDGGDAAGDDGGDRDDDDDGTSVSKDSMIAGNDDGGGDERTPEHDDEGDDGNGDDATGLHAVEAMDVSPPSDDDEVEVVVCDDAGGGGEVTGGAVVAGIDEDVEIVSPPPAGPAAHPENDAGDPDDEGEGEGDEGDEGVTTLSSNLTNATVDYPHARFECGRHEFIVVQASSHMRTGINKTALDKNRVHCPKCHCYVCDVPSAECHRWSTGPSPHCMATNASRYWVGEKDRARLERQNRRAGTEVITIDDSPTPTPTPAPTSRRRKKSRGGPPPPPFAPGGIAYPAYAAYRFARMAARAEAEAEAEASSEAAAAASTPRRYSATTSTPASSHAHPRHDPFGGGGVDDAFDTALAGLAHRYGGVMDREDEGREGEGRAPRDMKITEVLGANLDRILHLSSSSCSASASAAAGGGGDVVISERRENMDGDIPQLNLQKGFYVEGIKIGWPYPKVMPPQRQMAFHLIRALKNRLHVVIESPTGTGKSAAILCSVLAWRRWHSATDGGKRRPNKNAATDAKSEEDVAEVDGGIQAPPASAPPPVRVIYCSRTHTQVAQMVASLKKTPYRPRMAILGSRDRLCIHRKLRPRDGSDGPAAGTNVNKECRLRVRNTEKYRRSMWRSQEQVYDDENPPLSLPGDDVASVLATSSSSRGGGGGAGADASDRQHSQNSSGGGDNEEDDDGGGGGGEFMSTSHPMCPHYRQLTSNRLATLAHSSFVPNARVVNRGVSRGGEQTRLGSHDIEDLVSFGLHPHVVRGIALFRDRGHDVASSEGQSSASFGVMLEQCGDSVTVGRIRTNEAADREGSLVTGDRIVRVNGRDVSGWDVTRVAEEIRKTVNDPLVLDVHRGVASSSGDDHIAETEVDESYSSHAACPYYLSQALADSAELIFAPYNYILDPHIRSSLGIDLSDTVVVLDEAHNVESTLRESGSGKFGEFEMCDLVVMLSNYSLMEKTAFNLLDIEGKDGEKKYISDVAHSLLLFVERLVTFLRAAKEKFEHNPGQKGAAKAIRDYVQYHTPDDNEFEVDYYGPTGHGVARRPVGCQPFFDKIGIKMEDLEVVERYAEAFDSHAKGNRGDRSNREQDRTANLRDRLLELVVKFKYAIKEPEHYYISSVVKANGNFDYASGVETDGNSNERHHSTSRFKARPKKLPFMPPRTATHPDRLPNPCLNQVCKQEQLQLGSREIVRHGSYCDGSSPKWEGALVLNLLTPGALMNDLSSCCRTVVLASGTLAPIPSLVGELDLLPPKGSVMSSPHPGGHSPGDSSRVGRLQIQPKPLEANHVINLSKQLLAVSIGHFPDGSELTVKQANYSKREFVPKLGDAIAEVIECIPKGGVLVFFPSYSFLRKCVIAWNPTWRSRDRFWAQNSESPVWDRFVESKHKVIVEPSGNQNDFETARQDYIDTIRTNGSCVLLAVYRGKMSEGVSFNDDNARGVICIGVPYPNFKDRSIEAKRLYNDEQRLLRNRTNLLPGGEWYKQQAYRGLAQALGRCIRHAADYGTVVLMDSRHCDDGAPVDGTCRAHKDLPKWMRDHVKSLCGGREGGGIRRGGMYAYMGNQDSSSKTITGGWTGLSAEMKRFFREAPPYAAEVLEKQHVDLRAAQKFGNTPTLHVHRKGCTESCSSTLKNATAKSQETMVDRAPNREKAPKCASRNNEAIAVAASKPVDVQKNGTKRIGAIDNFVQRDSRSKKMPRRNFTKKAAPNSLKSMFDRQRAAAEQSQAVADSPAVFSVDPSPESQDTSPLAKNLADAMDVEISNEGGNQNALPRASTPFAPQSASNQSSHQSENIDDGLLCVVCEEHTRKTLILPCRHLCLCSGCSKLEAMINCPMCRGKIEDMVEVFM